MTSKIMYNEMNGEKSTANDFTFVGQHILDFWDIDISFANHNERKNYMKGNFEGNVLSIEVDGTDESKNFVFFFNGEQIDNWNGETTLLDDNTYFARLESLKNG
jgi:hypothetical protein